MLRTSTGIARLVGVRAGPGWAAEGPATEEPQPEPDASLAEIVVTATPTPQPLSTAPGDVEGVAAERPERRMSPLLDGTLRAVPGVYNRREEECSSVQPVIGRRRIARQNRTRVRLDGIPLNEPRTGAGYSDDLSVGDVERIEGIPVGYDPHKHHLQDLLTDLQYEHREVLISALHCHLDHDHCLERLAARGEAAEIKRLAAALIAAKDVTHGKLTFTTTGKDLPA